MENRLENVKKVAQGRWPALWEAAGMSATHFEKKNRPCPLCGGRDRFTYFPNESGGRWYCRGCGWGDGFDLLMRFTGKNFSETLADLEKRLGLAPAATQHGRATYTEEEKAAYAAKKRLEGRRITAQKLWEEGKNLQDLPDHPAHHYFARRGLTEALVDLKGLRVVDELPYWEEGKVLGNHPAILWAVTDENGTLRTIERLWLTKEGKKAPVTAPKKLWGPTEGGLVRLHTPEKRLGLTEGVETALAVRILTGRPVWAAISAVGLLGVTVDDLPETVEEVTIYGDNDETYTGAAAAYTLATKLVRDSRAQGRALRVLVKIPQKTGYDWNDVLLKSRESIGERLRPGARCQKNEKR